MATKGNTFPTLKDYYSQLDGKGNITSTIIDLFVQCNPMLEDAVTVECNDGTNHKTTVRNGLPEVEFRKFYQGVPSSKGDYTPVTDSTAMLESFSKVDKKLAELNDNTSQFRLNEADAHIQAMNNTVQENIIYGNKGKNAAAFDGLATRYNKTSNAKDTIGRQVIDAGGIGTSNTSIWFVGWGEKGVHLLYPKGSKAGLQHEDLKEEPAYDSNGNEYRVLKDHFSWDLGMCLRNYKTCARIANIDVSKLGTSDAVDLLEKMVIAYHRVKKHAKLAGAKLVIYVNETIETYLHLQAMEKKNVRLTLDEVAGEPVLKFLGIPIKCCDAILDTEDKVATAAA